MCRGNADFVYCRSMRVSLSVYGMDGKATHNLVLVFKWCSIRDARVVATQSSAIAVTPFCREKSVIVNISLWRNYCEQMVNKMSQNTYVCIHLIKIIYWFSIQSKSASIKCKYMAHLSLGCSHNNTITHLRLTTCHSIPYEVPSPTNWVALRKH